MDYESRIRDIYRDAVRRVRDPNAVRVLQALANEEQYHLDFLQERLDEWTATGQISAENLDTMIPPADSIARAADRLRSEMDAGKPGYAPELEALSNAIDVETETGEFYRKMSEQLEGPAKSLFARFVEIEQGHLALVRAEFDSVSGMGFWFDVPEFDLEAG